MTREEFEAGCALLFIAHCEPEGHVFFRVGGEHTIEVVKTRNSWYFWSTAVVFHLGQCQLDVACATLWSMGMREFPEVTR